MPVMEPKQEKEIKMTMMMTDLSIITTIFVIKSIKILLIISYLLLFILFRYEISNLEVIKT